MIKMKNITVSLWLIRDSKIFPYLPSCSKKATRLIQRENQNCPVTTYYVVEEKETDDSNQVFSCLRQPVLNM